MPFGFFYDPTFVLMLPAIALALAAQWLVSSTYDRYSRVPAASGHTGAEVAAAILRRSGIAAEIVSRGDRAPGNVVAIEPVAGTLSDHYDPARRVLRLSPGVFAGRSIAALGVAAHETGHALQQASGYAPMALRSAIVPVASIGTSAAWILALLGFLMRSPALIDVGIVLFLAYVLFALVTLPVELNASARAVAALQGGGFVHPQEAQGVRAVLNAAALTYVAAAAVAVIQLLRLVLLRGMTRDE